MCEGGALHNAADRCKFGAPLGQQKGTAGAQRLDKLAVTLFIPRNCLKICWSTYSTPTTTKLFYLKHFISILFFCNGIIQRH